MRMVEFVDIRAGREIVHVNPTQVAWVEEDPDRRGVVFSAGGREFVTPLTLAQVMQKLGVSTPARARVYRIA
jgi:hypothetical protein